MKLSQIILQYSLPIFILFFILLSNFFVEFDVFSQWFDEPSFKTQVLNVVMENVHEDESQLEENPIIFDDQKNDGTNNLPPQIANYIQNLKWDLVNAAIKSTQSQEIKVSSLFAMAVAQSQAKLPQRAIQNYQKLLAIQNNHSQAWYNLGVIYYQEQNQEEAIKALKQSIKLNKSSSSYAGHYNLGLIYLKQSNWDKARTHFLKAIKLNPGNVESRFNLGVIAQTNNQDSLATEYFEKALKIQPNYAKARHNLALLYLDQHKAKKARDLFISIDIKKSLPKSRVLYSQILFDLQQPQEARKILEDMITEHPAYAKSYFVLGLQELKSKNYLESIQHFQKALNLQPLYLEARYNLALSKFKLKEYQESIDDFNKVLQLDSTHFESEYNVGLAYLKLKKQKLAVSSFEKVLTINPSHYASLYNLGLALVRLNKFDQAFEYYKRAMKEQTNAEILFNIGRLFSLQDKYIEASNWFEQSIEKDPKYLESYLNLAIAQSKSGDHTKALETLKQVIEKDSTYAIAYYNRGVLLSRQDEDNAALESYQKAIQYDPKHIEARINLIVLLQREDQNNQVQKHFDYFQTNFPTEKFYFERYGRFLISQQKFQEAAAIYKSYIDENPGNAQARLNYALTLFHLKNDRESKRQFTLAQKLLKNTVSDHYDLALTYKAMNKDSEYAQELRKILTIKPKHKKSLRRLTIHYYNTGLAMRKSDNNDAALMSYLNALKYTPSHYKSNINAGVIYLEKKQPKLAQKYFEKALDKEPTSANALYYLAKANWEQKKVAIAKNQIDQAIKMQPESQEIQNLWKLIFQ